MASQPDPYPYEGHEGARLASTVFKVLAIIELIAGAITAFAWVLHENNAHATNGHLLGGLLQIIGAAIVAASLTAFLGYVLSLLVRIEINTRETAYNVQTGKVPTPGR